VSWKFDVGEFCDRRAVSGWWMLERDFLIGEWSLVYVSSTLSPTA
jgi:hypothetical protein